MYKHQQNQVIYLTESCEDKAQQTFSFLNTNELQIWK